MTVLPDGFLLGLDGVLLAAGAPIDGSVEAIVRLRAMGRPFRVIVADADADAAELAARLAFHGYSIDPEEIWSPGRRPIPPGLPNEEPTHPRQWLLGQAAADLGLPPGAGILVVGDDYDADLHPALLLGFEALLVRSGRAVDDTRIKRELPENRVADTFGAWLHRAMKRR